ncbi:MAG: hypothetical protein IJS34_00730 [Alphaproteobacteria bacterium]|nr:hypothetical protein [Alphaproteobacteria bacterium]
MRFFIKSFLFTIFLLLPHTVNAINCGNYTTSSTCNEHLDYCKWENGTCTERCPTNNDDTCINYDGCYTDAEFGGCSSCGPGEYNNTSGASSCLSCEDDFSYSQGQTFDTTYANTYGLDTCPWICTNGFFKGNNNSECLSCPDTTHPKTYGGKEINNIGTCTCPTDTNLIKTTESNGDKYYCGTCGVGNASTHTNITTCTCPATSNRVHGNQAYRTNNVPVECACPSGANWDSNRCKCNAGKYLSPGTDGVYSCKTCPSNGNCPEGSTWESATCATGYKKVTNTTDHTFTCESCSDSNATLDGNVCKCNAGYYGIQNGLDTECTQCPIGTTTTIGATQRSDCQMTSATKFCYGSDDNKKCMNLIPAGTVISAPNNT